MALKLPKREDIRNVLLGAARQVNLFDNGQTWKQAAPVTRQSTLQQAGGLLQRNIVQPAVDTAQHGSNTVAAGLAGLIGGVNIARQSAFGTDQQYRNAISTTQGAVDELLRSGWGNKGGYISPEAAATRGEGWSGVNKVAVKPVLQGTAEVAPYVVPVGAIGQGGKLLTRAGTQAAANAAVAGAADAANQYAQTGKVNVGAVAGSAAAGGAIGGAFPVAGSIVRKGGKLVKENAVPLDERGAVKLPGKKAKVSVKEAQRQQALAYVKEQEAAQKAARQSGVGDKLAHAQGSFKSKFIDSFSPIEDPVKKAVKAGAKINPEDNITLAIDRTLQSDRISGQYIRDNGLDKIIQSVPDTKAFEQYVIARHAADLEGRKIKTGRDPAKDRQLVQALAPEYEQHAQALNQYSQKLLDTAVQYGLVKKSVGEALKKKYPNYVPMERIFSESELAAMNQGTGAGKVSRSTQSVVRKIKGSDRVVESPLNAILKKTQQVVDQGETNNAARILASYKDLPGNPLGLRELRPSEVVGSKPVISFLENGRVRRFETTPEIAAAAKYLNREQMNIVAKIIQYPTRLLRLGATGANAAFASTNLVRDIATAFINSKHPLRSSVLNPSVFMDALTSALNHGSKQYGELLREGAAGTSFDIGRSNPVRNVRYVRSRKNIGTKALYTVVRPAELLRVVENTIGRSEEFTRAMQYYGNKQAFLKQGVTEPRARLLAAGEARNNTVNFSRAGDYGRALNMVLPYLNAGVQGSRTLVRNLRERPLQTSVKIAVTAFLPIAATTAWNLNDPKRKAAYDDISDYEKEHNIIIIPPNPKQDKSGKWNVVKIPVSQEVANLGNVVRQSVEQWNDDSRVDFNQVTADLLGTATSLQTGSLRDTANQFTPQAVKPAVETLANRNLYTGQEVVPDAVKNLAPEDQANKNTSGTARVLGRVTNQSPLVIDNAIRTAAGGGGQQLVNLADNVLAKTGTIEPNQVNGQNIKQSITGRFNKAQGNTPGTLYFTSLEQAARDQKLGGKDNALLNALKSKEIDANGEPVPQNEKDALSNAAIRANNPRVVAVEAAAARTLAKKTGQPLDPLYTLTPEQRQTYYRIQASPYKGDDYNRLTAQAQSWLPALQDKRSAFFDSIKKTGSTGVTPTARVSYPSFTDSTQAKLDTYFNLADPLDRVSYLKGNPDVSKAFEKINDYTNARRVAQGYDPFGKYPEPSPEVSAATDAYFAMDKASRKAWTKANPELYAGVQQALADSAAWQLANNAGQAKYQGETLNQKALKSAYSLGQYDIYKDPESGVYSIDPAAAFAANFQARYGGSGSSGSPSLSGNPFSRTISLKSGSGKVSRPKVTARKPRSGARLARAKRGGSKKAGSTRKYAVSLKRSMV